MTRRGIISGAIFGPQALGLLVGLILLTEAITSTASAYLVLTVAVVVLSVPFVLRYRDSPPGEARPPVNVRTLAGAIWAPLRTYPDFAWAFGGRVTVNIGNALGTTYLLYFFTDGLHLADPETSLLYVTAIYLVFTLLTTYAGGVLSDRSGRRRVFVAMASVLQGIAAILLVIWPSFSTTMIAAADGSAVGVEDGQEQVVWNPARQPGQIYRSAIFSAKLLDSCWMRSER
jgi:nitrate/nitrite transporter NarK